MRACVKEGGREGGREGDDELHTKHKTRRQSHLISLKAEWYIRTQLFADYNILHLAYCGVSRNIRIEWRMILKHLCWRGREREDGMKERGDVTHLENISGPTEHDSDKGQCHRMLARDICMYNYVHV